MGNANCKSKHVLKEDVFLSSSVSPTPPSPLPPVKDDGNTCVTHTATIPSTIHGDDFAIPIKTYEPKKSSSRDGVRAAVFFIHGGIFAKGCRDSHPSVAEGLASLNMAVVTASFRNGADAPNKTKKAQQDLIDVIKYYRTVHPNVPFGLVGSSSGGYFALSLCRSLGGSGIIDFCIPICPVAHPLRRASYLRSSISGSARLDGYAVDNDTERSSFILEKQMSFWANDDEMKEAGDALTTNEHNIPTLLILGSVDKNVPFQVTSDVQTWATRTVVIGGVGHEINDEIPSGYNNYLPDVDRFLKFVFQR